MTTYLALLRGINVGGVNRIPMKELRAVVEGMGHEEVRTYLQSGNVVFQSRATAMKKIGTGIEDVISKAFDIRIAVMMRSQRELKSVVSGNPFAARGMKPISLHVMFLAESATGTAVKTLDPDRSPPDKFEVKGREVYLLFPKGSGRSKLTIDYFEKKLGTRATARNWNTVTKLLELMEGP